MPKVINYKKELNLDQYEAALSTEGPHLVIAGAGSGKTRVLVFRTAYLVERGIDPSCILLLTFTRRAAKEMLDRASYILDDRCQKVSGGTFHSFANLTLRKYAESLGFSRYFTILDESDSQSAINIIRTHLGLNKADKRFPKKQTLSAIISKSVNKGIDVDSILYEEYPHFIEWSQSIIQIQNEYQQYKRNLSLMDFDDLLVNLQILLESQPSIRKKLSQQYQYIMVDEYQDTNKIQAQIIRLLTSEHDNIMVVGDDSQSIYSFRGAHFKNIIDFPKAYPKTKVIVLEENYRSSQPILDLTNEVINSADVKFDKALFTNNKGNTLPVYTDVLNEHEQSQYVVNKILELRAQGVPLNEMAVLFRSGWHSNDLEVELASQGLPFLKYGGQKFVESAHIKDVMGYLSVAFNMNNEVSWIRILTLMRGIGAKTAQRIAHQVTRENKSWKIDVKYFKKYEQLERLFEIFKSINIDHDTPEEVLTKFLEFYYPLLMDQYDDYDKRINDLDSLQKIVSRYDSLESFLLDMTLEPLEKSRVDAQRHLSDASNIVLSTIHSAKGLEWHTVFVIYLAEGYLPSYRSFESEEAIEEERRLFYVATTRAKQNLFLLRPQIDRAARTGMENSGSVYTRISRFLGEGRILHNFVNIESSRRHNTGIWEDAPENLEAWEYE